MNLTDNDLKKNQDAEDLYIKDALYKDFEDDRCLLYVYRLAVDFANGNNQKTRYLSLFMEW